MPRSPPNDKLSCARQPPCRSYDPAMGSPPADEFAQRLQRLAENQRIESEYLDALRRRAAAALLLALGLVAAMCFAWWVSTWNPPSSPPTVVVVPALPR